ncbi:helix-turn-helix domain-containing protein [Streptomyces sp. NPDC005485]|uniref:helix-turn-helix domain-containing protein n=1 Tax=Streptomyces sp. NPDC005485 TaxID=3155591 RepID=UPI0033ACA8CE
MPPQRVGEQAQFIERRRPAASGTKGAHMSRRRSTRRLREETGTSPLAWLTGARINRARELLETTGPLGPAWVCRGRADITAPPSRAPLCWLLVSSDPPRPGCRRHPEIDGNLFAPCGH